MQDVQRPADVEPLAEPARARGPRVELQSQADVLRVQRVNRICGHRDRRRYVR